LIKRVGLAPRMPKHKQMQHHGSELPEGGILTVAVLGFSTCSSLLVTLRTAHDLNYSMLGVSKCIVDADDKASENKFMSTLHLFAHVLHIEHASVSECVVGWWCTFVECALGQILSGRARARRRRDATQRLNAHATA
jgi:hypothetical protein